MIEKGSLEQIIASTSMRLCSYAIEHGLSESATLDYAIDRLKVLRDRARNNEEAEIDRSWNEYRKQLENQ